MRDQRAPHDPDAPPSPAAFVLAATVSLLGLALLAAAFLPLGRVLASFGPCLTALVPIC